MHNSPAARIFLPALLVSSGLFTCLTVPLALHRSNSIRVNIPLVYQGDVPPIFHPDRRDIAIRYVGISILLSVAAGFASVELSRKQKRLDQRLDELLVDESDSAGPPVQDDLPDSLSAGQLIPDIGDASYRLDTIRCCIVPPGTSLQENDLSRADLSAVDLSRANLSKIDLSESALTGAQLAQADLSHGKLQGSNLQQADLQQANCTYANFQNANLDGANFQQANLIGADLTRTNLTGARLRKALYDSTTKFPLGFKIGQQDLYWIGPEAPLWGLDLSHVNLSGANLKGANLTGTVLAGADLWGSNLEDADLTGANLSGTILTGASLKGVNLTGATLRYANLTDADLTNANLTDVDLTDTVLDGARLEPDSGISAPKK